MTVPNATSRAAAAAVLLLACAAPASASWSIVAVDQATGRVAVASAACVSQANIREIPARDLMDIQAVIVPGKGAAVVQGAADRSRKSQDTFFAALARGEAPADALHAIAAWPESAYRQFGVVDLQGRSASSTGSGVGGETAAMSGQVSGTGIYYSAQGDQLPSAAVVSAAVSALARPGTLADRVLAALEAGDANGGDRRCSCQTMPRPSAPCETRTALVAYLVVADAGDVVPAGGPPAFTLSLSVSDEDITRAEDANPVKTLGLRYAAWKKAHTR